MLQPMLVCLQLKAAAVLQIIIMMLLAVSVGAHTVWAAQTA